jgi:peptidoglycan/LPS O-acetylase OafA/YrhL
MGATLTAGGVGLTLAAVAGICIWKKHAEKFAAWMALVAGLFASFTVISWLGSMAAMTVAGMAVTTVVVILGGLVFWLEVIKKKAPHRFRTPVVAFALGVALTATFGGVQNAVQHSTVQVTTFIHGSTGR